MWPCKHDLRDCYATNAATSACGMLLAMTQQGPNPKGRLPDLGL